MVSLQHSGTQQSTAPVGLAPAVPALRPTDVPEPAHIAVPADVVGLSRFAAGLRHAVALVRETVPPMHPAGRPFVAGGAAAALLLGRFSPAAGVLGAAATACCATFFREPRRVPPQDPGLA